MRGMRRQLIGGASVLVVQGRRGLVAARGGGGRYTMRDGVWVDGGSSAWRRGRERVVLCLRIVDDE
jgi:hypothetical protein